MNEPEIQLEEGFPPPTVYTFYDPGTGQILASGSTYTLEASRPSGNAVLLEGVMGDIRNQYVHDSELVFFPPRPGPWYVWDWESHNWQIPSTALFEAKRVKKLEVDSRRREANEAPLFYRSNSFDGDTVAQNNVMAWMVNISNGLQVPPGFVWRDASNVDHPADEEFITGLGAAMVQRGSQLYQMAWQQKAAIDALTSVSEVDNYTIPF